MENLLFTGNSDEEAQKSIQKLQLELEIASSQKRKICSCSPWLIPEQCWDSYSPFIDDLHHLHITIRIGYGKQLVCLNPNQTVYRIAKRTDSIEVTNIDLTYTKYASHMPSRRILRHVSS